MAALNALLCVAEGLSTGPLLRACLPHTHPDFRSYGWKELDPRCLPGPIWPAFTLYMHYMTALWFHPTVGLPWKWTPDSTRSASTCVFVCVRTQTQRCESDSSAVKVLIFLWCVEEPSSEPAQIGSRGVWIRSVATVSKTSVLMSGITVAYWSL